MKRFLIGLFCLCCGAASECQACPPLGFSFNEYQAVPVVASYSLPVVVANYAALEVNHCQPLQLNFRHGHVQQLNVRVRHHRPKATPVRNFVENLFR